MKIIRQPVFKDSFQFYYNNINSKLFIIFYNKQIIHPKHNKWHTKTISSVCYSTKG